MGRISDGGRERGGRCQVGGEGRWMKKVKDLDGDYVVDLVEILPQISTSERSGEWGYV